MDRGRGQEIDRLQWCKHWKTCIDILIVTRNICLNMFYINFGFQFCYVDACVLVCVCGFACKLILLPVDVSKLLSYCHQLGDQFTFNKKLLIIFRKNFYSSLGSILICRFSWETISRQISIKLNANTIKKENKGNTDESIDCYYVLRHLIMRLEWIIQRWKLIIWNVVTENHLIVFFFLFVRKLGICELHIWAIHRVSHIQYTLL